MRQTLLLERVMDQTRLAVIEDGALCELYCEDPDSEDLSGNIYLGRVENVLPGMNAAFVDIGLPKNGFLSAGDIRLDALGAEGLAEALKSARIERLARPGQEVLVQAVKSQPGAKGPRLSCHITLPGRLMVLLPGVRYVGVSRKIKEGDVRDRLYEAGRTLVEGGDAGIILRTAASAADAGELSAEYDRLRREYAALSSKARSGRAPRLLHNDNALALKLVRDMLNEDVDAVWIDDPACYAEVADYARLYAPALADRIRLHGGCAPLFDLYRVDTQAEKALQRFVWLKGGGSLVIEETEALTVVDVNTGKNVGRHSAEETIYENNCEAARELMRQLRLRDIGGIVVVDFIDMQRDDHRQALLELMRSCALQDRNRTSVVDITRLGLVELTRKKTNRSMFRQMMRPCSKCGGNGAELSHEAAARRVIRALWRRRRGGDDSPLLIEASPPVCARISRIGTPAGGRTALKAIDSMSDGEFRFSPLCGKERNEELT